MTGNRPLRRLMIGLALLSLVLPTVAASAQEHIELNLIHCWGALRDPWVQDQIAIFNREYPNVTVNTKLAGCNALQEEVIISIASGAPYQVPMLRGDGMLELARQGALMSLTPFLEREGISESIWFPAEIEAVKYEGQVYGLPHRAGADMNNILLYNTQLFAEAGLDPNAPPTTFEELDTVSRSLTRFNGDQIVVVPFDFQDQGTYGPLAWLYAGGGTFLSPDGSEAAFYSPEALETINFVRDYIARHLRGPANIKGGNAAFANNQVAMLGRGTFSYAAIREINPDTPIAMALRPKKPDSPWTGVYEPTLVFSIPKGLREAEIEAAWKLIYYLTIDEESAGGFLLRQGRPSPIQEYNFNPMYFEINPYFGIIPSAMETAAPLPLPPGFTDVLTQFRQTWHALERNHALVPNSELQEAARVANAILREYAGQ